MRDVRDEVTAHRLKTAVLRLVLGQQHRPSPREPPARRRTWRRGRTAKGHLDVGPDHAVPPHLPGQAEEPPITALALMKPGARAEEARNTRRRSPGPRRRRERESTGDARWQRAAVEDRRFVFACGGAHAEKRADVTPMTTPTMSPTMPVTAARSPAHFDRKRPYRGFIREEHVTQPRFFHSSPIFDQSFKQPLGALRPCAIPTTRTSTV